MDTKYTQYIFNVRFPITGHNAGARISLARKFPNVKYCWQSKDGLYHFSDDEVATLMCVVEKPFGYKKGLYAI